MSLEQMRILQSPEGDASPGGAAPAGGEPPAATPAPGAPEPDAALSFDQIESLLSYDPFSKEKPGPADGGGGNPPDPATNGQPPTPGAPGGAAAPQNPPQPPAPPGAPTDTELLNAKIAELQTQLTALKSPPGGQPPGGAPAAPGGQPPAGQEESEVPPYDFTIPPQLMQLLDSENPTERQQGYGALLKGTAQVVHKTLMGQMVQVVSEMSRAIPSVINEQLQSYQTAQAIFQDFYGEYKDLNRPELRGLVQETAKQVMTETGLKTWGPALRQAIAARVYGVLGRQLPGMSRPPAAPPVIPAGGAPRVAGAPSAADDIATTLFG